MLKAFKNKIRIHSIPDPCGVLPSTLPTFSELHQSVCLCIRIEVTRADQDLGPGPRAHGWAQGEMDVVSRRQQTSLRAVYGPSGNF
eukprot:1290169-Karenia_brevis.AAC.1